MGGMNGMPPGGPGGPGGPMPGSMNPGQPMPGGMPPTDEVSASEASRKRDPSKPVGMPDLPKDVVIKKVDPPGSSSAGHKQ